MPLSPLVRQLQQVPLTGEVLARIDRPDRLRLSGAGRGARALISSALAASAEAPRRMMLAHIVFPAPVGAHRMMWR